MPKVHPKPVKYLCRRKLDYRPVDLSWFVLASRARVLADLEKQEIEKKSEADRVGDDDDDIALEEAVDHPQGDPGGQNGQHLQGEIAAGACLPALLHLRNIRHRGAEGGHEPYEGFNRQHAVTMRSAERGSRS